MQTYKVKVSFRVSGPGFGMSTREETHNMVLSAFDTNRIREWLENHYKVEPHKVTVFNYNKA
jgi:hypothetical protein